LKINYPVSIGDYIKVKSINFRKGAKIFEASVSSATQDGKFEIRIDSLTGPLMGTCMVENTGDW